MKKYLQSYHAFLPGTFMRWILYLVYPMAMVAVFFGGRLWFEQMALMMMVPIVMLGAECMIDMFVFGGFGAKGNAGNIEYMMASTKGRGMVNRALAVDWIRRLLYLFVMAAVVYVSSCWEQGGNLDETMMQLFLCILAAAAFLMSIALWVIRLIDNRAVQFGAMYIVINLPACLFMILAKKFEMNFKWLGLACMVLLAISVAGQIWFLTKKVREGYYDE